MIAMLARGRRPAHAEIRITAAAPRTAPGRAVSNHGGVLCQTDRTGLTFEALTVWLQDIDTAGVTTATVVEADTHYRDWAPDELNSAPIITVAAKLGDGYETMTNLSGLTVRDLHRFIAAAKLLDGFSKHRHVLVRTSRLDRQILETTDALKGSELRRALSLAVATPGAFRG
jgi:hypothetical protein